MKRKSSFKSRFKVKIVTRSALIRLAVLLAILLILGVWAWLTMFWMPEQSYRGQLPPLQNQEIELKNSLQRDIQKIASEIGARNNVQYAKLNAARFFFETALNQSGYDVKQKEYTIQGKPYYNIEAEKLGTEKPRAISF